jgi:hypothetical protein
MNFLMMMVLSRRLFDTFWQIIVGFRPANFKLRNLRVWTTFFILYYKTFVCDKHRIRKNFKEICVLIFLLFLEIYYPEE